MQLAVIILVLGLPYCLTVKHHDGLPRGLVTPVFTPVNEDQTVNYHLIPLYAEYLAKNGLNEILVGGTTSENMNLNVYERKRVLDAWLSAANSTGLRVMFQVGAAPLDDVIELTRYGATKPLTGIVTLPELYFKPTTVEELVFFVSLVAEHAPDMPIVYYHFPEYTNVNVNMSAFAVEATARISNFKGIKYTSYDLNDAAAVARRLRHDQVLYLAADTLLAPSVVFGITSSIGTSYSLFPQLAQQTLSAALRADLPRARRLQDLLARAIDAVTDDNSAPFIPRFKAGFEIITGIPIGPPLLPERDLSEKDKMKIRERLAGLGLVEPVSKSWSRHYELN